MPPQIGDAIVAIEHDLDPQIAYLIVGNGIPISFLTLPLWREWGCLPEIQSRRASRG